MRMSFPAALLVAAIATLSSCAGAPEPAAPPSSGGDTGAAPASGAAKDRAKALAQGGLDAGTPAPSQPAAAQASAAQSASADQPPPLPGKLTPEEEAFLASYLNRLNYMVYYDDQAQVDPVLAKRAVSMANRYLIEKLGLSVIDFDQIEKNKKDQLAAYQSETGGSIDIVQYLAQKFNADVYVELSFTVASETRDSKHYATASGSMKIFDVSTAALLGSIVLASGGAAMSPNSADAAATNAVTAPIWQAMPKMIDQSKQLIKNSLGRGIRYEVVLQKTPDSKAVSQLRRALSKKVREVEQASYSPASTKLYVYTFQAGDKVEDALYDAATSAGMPDLNLIYSRGKSYTFDTGM
jgi:hypothetical protein